MEVEGPPLCLFEGCEFFGSMRYDYYCSRHYHLKQANVLNERKNEISPLTSRKIIETPPRTLSSKSFKVKAIELLKYFQKELVPVINVKYATFISSPSINRQLSREEIVSLKYEDSSKKFIDLFIDKGQRRLVSDEEMVACLQQGAKDAGNSLLLSLLLFDHLPARETFCMFSTFVEHFLKQFMESVTVSEDLLNRLSSFVKLSSSSVEAIRSSKSDQPLTLLSCLPYRHFRWYPNLLCALILSKQYDFIKLVHSPIYDKAVRGKLNYFELEEYCHSLCKTSYNTNKCIDPPTASTSGNKLVHRFLDSESDDDEDDDENGDDSDNDDEYNHDDDEDNDNDDDDDDSDDDDGDGDNTVVDKVKKPSESLKSSVGEKSLVDYLLGSDDDNAEMNSPPPSSSSSSPAQSPAIDLYDYQRELAEPALRGENVIVISPTNSGKTHVAMAVIQHHLKINPKKCAIFIAPRQNLVEQQHRLIEKHFPDKKVAKVCGGGNAQTNLKLIVLANNIVVVTAECLRNALDVEAEKDRVHFNQLSLLVFDECHNCTKSHPYNMIMNRYHDANIPTTSKPKILGLTASPGTDRASNSKQAFEHIITLCANLDCKRITHKCEQDIHLQSQQLLAKRTPAPFRKIGWLDTQLQQGLEMCEEELLKMYRNGEIPLTASQFMTVPCKDRGMPPYDNFVGNLKYIDTLIPCTQTQVLVRLNCLKTYLDLFNRSLIIYRLFRDEDTLGYIRSKLDFKSPADGIHKMLVDFVEKKILQPAKLHMETNPCMEYLLQCVRQHLEKEPDSRILVFVKQRNYAYFLKDAFNSDPHLRDVPVDVIIGAQSDGVPNRGTNTNKWQMEVLEKFHQGKNKVLFSTAVAEEGLDVVRCNVVIRYAHVTNEISMVQSKGRARTANPNYIIIYPSHEMWLSRKETTNEGRHNMMIEAVLEFQKLDISETSRKIKSKQMQLQEIRRENKTDKERLNMSRPKVNENKDYAFHCMSCHRKACTSRDIRKRKGSYVCIDKAIKQRCIIPTTTDGSVDFQSSVTCSTRCSHKWGVVLHFNDSDWICLSIQNFRLVPLDIHKGATSKICDKWSDAPFDVHEITMEEIYANY